MRIFDPQEYITVMCNTEKMYNELRPLCPPTLWEVMKERKTVEAGIVYALE